MLSWLKDYSRDAAASRFVEPQRYPLRMREVSWTLILVAAFTIMRALLNLPSLAIAKWYAGQLGDGARVLIGQPLITGDIAGNFAQARALLEPSYRAYDQLVQLFPLIGVDWDVPHGHPRLPMEIPLFLPIGAIDFSSPVYKAFAYALPVLAILALAWSLRLLDIPPVAAWLVTGVLVVSPIGYFALESSYPFVAVALALAWRFRDRPWIASIGLVVAGAGRGVGLLPSAYFLVARSWRTLIWLIAMLAALLAIAVVLEPTIVSDFLDRGLYWGRINADRPDNASLSAALIRPVYAYAAALIIFVLAARRPELLFWSLAWLSAALAPIAWTYAAVALFPLAAFLWSKGNVARVCVAASGVLLVSNGSYAGLTYAGIVVLLGAGLIAGGWHRPRMDSSGAHEEANARI